jgi:ABC-type polysaccharide/polyol phosphate export permease
MMIEKINGIRNRLIVAGVKLHQFILAHAIEGCVMLLIHFMTCVAFTLVFFVEVKTFTSLSLIVAIFVMCGLLGIFSAFFIPLVFNDITAATLFNQFILFASMFVSGVFWPIEAFPKMFETFNSFCAFTFPIKAIRSIAFKEASIDNHLVQMAFWVLLVYILMTPFICLVVILLKNLTGTLKDFIANTMLDCFQRLKHHKHRKSLIVTKKNS